MATQSSLEASNSGASERTVADVCLDVLCQDLPCSETPVRLYAAWYPAVKTFATVHQHVNTIYWLRLPAATDLTCKDPQHQPAAMTNSSLSDTAIQRILEFLLQQSQLSLGNTAEIAAQPAHNAPVFTDMNINICSILLVLHVFRVLTPSGHASDLLYTATQILLHALSNLQLDLADNFCGLIWPPDPPSNIKTDLVLRIVQHAMWLLRHKFSDVPGAILPVIDTLLLMRKFAPVHSGLAEAIVQQGGMASLLVGLSKRSEIATKTAQLLCWLCESESVPLVVRLQNCIMLDQLSGMHYLGQLLASEAPGVVSMAKTDGKAAVFEVQLLRLHQVVLLMDSLLLHRQDCGGLTAVQAEPQAVLHESIHSATEDAEWARLTWVKESDECIAYTAIEAIPKQQPKQRPKGSCQTQQQTVSQTQQQDVSQTQQQDVSLTQQPGMSQIKQQHPSSQEAAVTGAMTEQQSSTSSAVAQTMHEPNNMPQPELHHTSKSKTAYVTGDTVNQQAIELQTQLHLKVGQVTDPAKPSQLDQHADNVQLPSGQSVSGRKHSSSQRPSLAFPCKQEASAHTWPAIQSIAHDTLLLLKEVLSCAAAELQDRMTGKAREGVNKLLCSLTDLLARLLTDHLLLKQLDVNQTLSRLRVALVLGDSPHGGRMRLTAVVVDRLMYEFEQQLHKDAAFNVEDAFWQEALCDCQHLWRLRSMLQTRAYSSSQLTEPTRSASLSKILDLLYLAVSLAPTCESLRYDAPSVKTILADAKLPSTAYAPGNLPRFAAVLAQICQVQLQLGHNDFYRRLVKCDFFDRSLASAAALLEKVSGRAEGSGLWTRPELLLSMSRFLWRMVQLVELLPKTLPARADMLTTLSSRLVDILPSAPVAPCMRNGVADVRKYFIACSVQYISTIRGVVGQASGPGGSPLKEQQTILGLYSSLTLRLPTSTNRTALPSLAAQVETAPARAQGQADSSTNSISEAVLATASEAEQVTIAMAYVPAGQVPGDLPACLQCASTDHITQPPPLCAFMEDECEDVDTDFRCIEAGLPYVSSLTLAALCLHGALTAANVAGAWVPVHRNTYQQCVRFFADFVDAWRDISLRVDVAKQWDPQEYKIPSLGPCISFICKATLQQLDNEPRLGLAAEAGMAILHLFLMLVGFLHISYIASLGMQPATGQSQEQAQQCVGSSSGSSRLSKSKESVAKARELLGHHEPVLHDQALADAIVTSTPNVKSLLDVTMCGLKDVQTHPTWSGLLSALTTMEKWNSAKRRFWAALHDLEAWQGLTGRQLAAVKDTYHAWLRLPDDEAAEQALAEKLQSKAAAKKAKKQRQKAAKQQGQTGQSAQPKPCVEQEQQHTVPQQAQQAEPDDVMQQAQHVEHSDTMQPAQQPQQSAGLQLAQQTDQGEARHPALQKQQGSTMQAAQQACPAQVPGNAQDHVRAQLHDSRCRNAASEMSDSGQQHEPRGLDSFLQDLVCCPLTQAGMVDPVIAADGHTYERAAIEAWLKQHSTSPVSGHQLAHKRIVSNHIVKSVIAMQ